MVKKICAVALCSFMLTASSALPVMASDTKNVEIAPVEIQVDYTSEKSNIDGTSTYDVINADEVAAFYGIDNPKEVKVTTFNKESKPIPAPRSIYINNVKAPKAACGAKEITRNSAVNNSNKTITKTITLTGGVSNTYSTSVEGGLNVEVASISAAVGFDVTDSWEMSDSTEVVLQPRETVSVTAYPLYDVYRFDVINDPIFGGPEKIGYGDAFECKGFCTVIN